TSTTPEEVDATVERLEAARATLGDRAKLHLTLGVLYARKQDLPRAERAFQEAVAREPKSVEAHSLLGSFYLSKRDSAQAERETTEAIQDFQKVLKLEPRHAPTHYQLGLAQLMAGNPQQAKAELKEATSLAPNFSDAVLLLAQLNLRTGAVQPAIDDLERFVAGQPRALNAT